MSKKILIMGGAGFIGYSIATELSLTHKVIICDRFNNKNVNDFISNNIKFYKMDCHDTEQVYKIIENERPSIIFDAIGDVSYNNNDNFNIQNIRTRIDYIDYCNNNDIKYIYLSSLETKHAQSFKKSNYVLCKICVEHIIKEFTNRSNLNGTILCVGSVYGKPINKKYKGVVNIFINNALNNEDILIYKSNKTSRKFVYIDDILNAIKDIIKLDLTGILHLNGLVNIDVKDLAEFIVNETNSKSKIKYINVDDTLLYEEKAPKYYNYLNEYLKNINNEDYFYNNVKGIIEYFKMQG